MERLWRRSRLNQDNTVNDLEHPAERGSIVSIYATGAGAMSPAGVDGEVTKGAQQFPLMPVKVSVGD